LVSQLQTKGASVIILTGGEPMKEFDKLLSILKNSDKNLSDFHLHTSGFGVTYERAKELKNAGLTAAAVGLDHYIQSKNDIIRGEGSYKCAVNALEYFNKAGILTYVNLCATNTLLCNEDIWKYYDLMKRLNVSIIQLLEPRPYGGYFNAELAEILSKSKKEILLNFTKKGNSQKKFRDYPLIYYVAHIEGKEQMGCMMGGLSHFYVDSQGNFNPCVFLPVSFGNINTENFDTIYSKMRKFIPYPLHQDCPSISLHKAISNKVKNSNGIPIPIEEIVDDWSKLFQFNKENIRR
jgi:MoaA/NifB/PqqE/SkfB family radical SAM enzyme